MSYGISPNGLPCVKIPTRMGHHSVTERCKTGSASDLVEVESHDFNRGSVSKTKKCTLMAVVIAVRGFLLPAILVFGGILNDAQRLV